MDKLKLFGIVLFLFVLIPTAFAYEEISIRWDADTTSGSSITGRHTNSDYFAVNQNFNTGTLTEITNISVRVALVNAHVSGQFRIDIDATESDLGSGTAQCESDTTEITGTGTYTFNFTGCSVSASSDYYYGVVRDNAFPVGDYIQFYSDGGTDYSGYALERTQDTTDIYTWDETRQATQDISSKIMYYPAPVAPPYFKVYSQNYTNHSETYNINTFNLTLSLANGTIYNFTTNTGNITTNLNNSEIANITISSFMSNSYINQYFENWNISITPLIFNYSVVNITAQDGITSGEISSFNITFNGATTQSVNKSVLIYTDPSNYTFTGVAEGYNSKSFSLNTTENASDYTLTLYGKNSVLINIYNATDSVKLSQSATVLLEGTNYTQSNVTSDGDIFIQDLTAGSYDVLVTSTGFQNGAYTITIGENTFQTLNVYLTEESDTDVIFSFIDQNTGEILEGVSFDVEQFINASYILINSLTSDVSGRVSTGYVSDGRYRYTAEFDGYETKQFILDPVIFSSYTVRLVPNISNTNLEQNAGIGIVITPSTYYDDTTNNFSITFSSSTGDLLYYNYTISVSSGGTYSGNGNNAYGGTLENTVNISGASSFDRVTVAYRYVKSDGTDYTQYRVYSIANADTNTFTFLDNADNPYNLPLFDRVVILVVTTLIASGLAYWFAGFAGSSMTALLVLGYFGAVGLVPMWAVWMSLTIGAILIIWRSSA